MLSDWELWACASKLIESRGDHASRLADARIEALEGLGETEGALVWRGIRYRIGQLAKDRIREIQSTN